MRHVLPSALFLALLTTSVPLAAQRPAGADSVGATASPLPLSPSRTARFSTDEGTWMSLDVSPDGRTIVFDLLGDLYTLPIGGGKAARIADGLGFDAQPRFSPDGKHIVFVSDRGGSDNLWIAEADGKRARALTKLEKTQFVSPEWTPDGRYIVVSRNAAQFSPQYDLYLYHRDGGTGIKLTGGSAAESPDGSGGPPLPNNYVGAAFGKDPRYVYAAARTGAGGYNQTSFGWQVAVHDRETGMTFTRTSALGGAMRPVLSPDGRYLVYATRDDSVTSLRLRELSSGDERWLVRNVQRDDQESRFTRDLMPGMSFTPDSRSLIAAYGGRFHRIDVATGQAAPIPFTADVEIALGALSKFEYALDDTLLTVRQIRDARPSPDGRQLAFTALDRVWVMDLPGGTPRRLTRGTQPGGEHAPVWSPDGRYVAFVTWDDQGGALFRARADGREAPERLTRQSAYYDQPNYTPDGTRLVVVRGPRQPRIERDEFSPTHPHAAGLELVWLPAAGGEATSITPLTSLGFPHFTRAGDRVYVYDRRDGLVSMRFDGTDRRAIMKVTGYVQARAAKPRPTPADAVLIAPDGERAVVMADNNVYVVAVPLVGGETPTVSVVNPATAAVPVRRLTRIGGEFAGWFADGRRVHYSIGRSFFAYDLARADSLVRDSTARADSVKLAGGKARGDSAAAGDSAKAKAAKPAYEPARTDVAITVRRDRPSGVVVLRNARIITMKGAEVIERGDVVVRDNRIAAVGAAGTVRIPAGAHVVDVAGKTLLPGWVDIHAHMWPSFGIHRTQPWEYLANLAYGVTTTRDPQTSTTDVLAYADLVETGDMIGPRVLSTGPGVFWSDDIKSLDDARDVLRRYTEFYGIQTIKQYMVGDRKVRQWVIMAARELGLTPTLEGGLDFKKNLTEAIDGYAGSEHSYPIAPLFKDVIQLLVESGITYTPTLLVQYGGPWAENYWYQRHDVLRDEKLARFTPKVALAQRGLRRSGWWHESQYSFALQAAQARKLVEAGGRVGLGGHGQLQGLGVHWELWSIASGGMKPHDVLRVGTVLGAEAIGLGKQLGSIEAGKLADLQVLDADPLADIRNTNTVRYVMKNGRLYEAGTLTEIWPRQRTIARRWWDDAGSVSAGAGDEGEWDE